jgi:hypothetical protein
VVPRSGLKGCREEKCYFPTGVQTPEGSVCNETLYRLCYPGIPVCGESKCKVALVHTVKVHVESGSEVTHTFVSSALDGSEW